MSPRELKILATRLSAIADGAEWECEWAEGWGPPLGRDVEYCIAHRVPIRLKISEQGAQILLDARDELFGAIEEISQATMMLQEARTDLLNGLESSAALCAMDALEITSSMELKFSEITARLVSWTQGINVEGDAQ